MPTDTPSPELLNRIGNVPASYVHHDRHVEPRDPLISPNGIFKWYNVYDRSNPIPDGLQDRSRLDAFDLLASGNVAIDYGMGLIVLHHSSANDFILVGGWRGHQEYWQTIYIRTAHSEEDWVPVEKGLMSPACCVWEMTPIWHERNAWVVYLKSERATSDKVAWLDDRLTADM